MQLFPESKTFKKMVKDRCLYTSMRNRRVKTDNSFAVTEINVFIQIIDFIVDERSKKEFTICKMVEVEPIVSTRGNYMPIMKVKKIHDTETAILTKTIKKVCVLIKPAEEDRFISPVPHLLHY